MQRVLLGGFALFALLTAFFQLRTGMKEGQAERTHSSVPSDGVRHMAHLCAVISALCLIACIAIGAIQMK